MPVFYLVYGLKIEANEALPGLRVQPDLPDCDVQVTLKQSPEFLPFDPDSTGDFLYASPNSDADRVPSLRVLMLAGGDYYGFFYGDGVRFAVERKGRKIWADWPDGYSLEDACTYLIGPVIAFALRLQGWVCLHASSVAVGNRAIALLGAPGAGKSTTAAAITRMGFPVLSDDVVVLADAGDRFLVQPGYPRVNLWPDSVHQLFGSEDALPRITPTWGKRYLALNGGDYCFQATPLPLGAVYVFGDREEQLRAPILEEIRPSDALITLVTNSYVNYLIDAAMRSREFDVLGRLVNCVPVWRVRPTADSSKISALCEAIIENASRQDGAGAMVGHAQTKSAI